MDDGTPQKAGAKTGPPRASGRRLLGLLGTLGVAMRQTSEKAKTAASGGWCQGQPGTCTDILIRNYRDRETQLSRPCNYNTPKLAEAMYLIRRGAARAE